MDSARPSAPSAAPGAPWLRPLLLREERAFSQLFGGYAVELPGAVLVVNERVPVPRFNWVQDAHCGPGRVAPLLEEALQHYYQRALRPTFEVRSEGAEPALLRGLGQMGYRSRGAAHRRQGLVRRPGRDVVRPARGFEVAPVPEEELGLVVDLLAEERFKEELHRSLVVTTLHPLPEERTVPYLARVRGEPVSVGLYHVRGPVGGLFAVGTRGPRRRQGAASALVRGILARERPEVPIVVTLDGARAPAALLELGFAPYASFDVYELGHEAARRGY